MREKDSEQVRDRWESGRETESMKEGRKEDEEVHESVEKTESRKQTICHSRVLHTVIKNDCTGGR